MKKQIFFLLIIAISFNLFAQDSFEPAAESSKKKSSGSSSSGISFGGAAAGAQISLVLANEYYSVLPAAAFGFGLQGYIDVKIGRFGNVQYYPSITMWFRSERNPWPSAEKAKDGMVALSIFDFKYLFPLPENIFARPYVGLGPAVIIHTYGQDPSAGESWNSWSDSYVDAGFNLFAGIDLKVAPIIAPFIEARLCANDFDLFKLTAGLNILF